jgi:hypothetical protein
MNKSERPARQSLSLPLSHVSRGIHTHTHKHHTPLHTPRITKNKQTNAPLHEPLQLQGAPRRVGLGRRRGHRRRRRRGGGGGGGLLLPLGLPLLPPPTAALRRLPPPAPREAVAAPVVVVVVVTTCGGLIVGLMSVGVRDGRRRRLRHTSQGGGRAVPSPIPKHTRPPATQHQAQRHDSLENRLTSELEGWVHASTQVAGVEAGGGAGCCCWRQRGGGGAATAADDDAGARGHGRQEGSGRRAKRGRRQEAVGRGPPLGLAAWGSHLSQSALGCSLGLAALATLLLLENTHPHTARAVGW